MRLLCLVILVLLFSFNSGYSQEEDIRYLVDCARGVSYVSNAASSRDGRAIVVGDLGRMGVIGPTDQEFTWYCLPEQPFLYDAWIEHDTIVVVGEDGAVWWRAGTEGWKNVKIPAKEICRTIAKQRSTFYIGTEQGSIWKCDGIGSATWTREATFPASILDIYADDSTLVAVGGVQGLYEWSSNSREWIDLSQHSDSSVYAVVRPFRGYYVVGADSGQVLRFHRATQKQSVSQMFPPSTSEPFPDFRGRNDRTLSICEGNQGDLIVTGNYREGSSPTTGVYLSIDSGSTWKHQAFYDNSTTFEWYSTEYCPLVMYHDSILTAVVANSLNPIVVYRTSNLGATWRKSQCGSMYQLLPNTSNFPDSSWHTYVDAFSGIVLDRDPNRFITSSHAIPQNADDRLYKYTRTHLINWTVSKDSIQGDTVAALQGKFEGLQRRGTDLLMCGDSLRLATSNDNGKTWAIDRIDPLSTTSATARQVLLKEAQLAYINNVGYLKLDKVGNWEKLKFRSDSLASPLVVNARQYRENSALIEVDYYQKSTLLYRTLQVLMTNGTSYSIDSVATIPARAYTAPALFVDKDSICILMPTLPTGQTTVSRQLRCVYIGDEWRCDTMYIQLKNGNRVPFVGAEPLALYDHGSVVVCERFTGGSFYSTDRCKSWKVLPYASTFFHGPMWATALNGDQLYIAGYRYLLASITIPVETSVLDSSNQSKHEQPVTLLQSFVVDNPDATLRVSTILGMQLDEVVVQTFADVHEYLSKLQNDTYVLSSTSCRQQIVGIVMVFNGEVFEPVLSSP